MASQPVARLTEEEYLAHERTSEYRSEFVGGEMFAMSGGTLRHNALAVAFLGLYRETLRRRGCFVFSADAKVRTAASRSYVYPDVAVTCGSVKLESEYLENPKLIVEVLSPSTADYDRGTKFGLYREIPALDDYVILHQERIRAEHWRRLPEGWLLRDYEGPDSVIPIDGLGLRIELDQLYAGLLPEEG